MKKKCTQCGEVLELNNFTKNKNLLGGFFNQCKRCRNQCRAQWLRTPAGKRYKAKVWRRWKKTLGGKAHEKRYRQSELGKSYKARADYKRRNGNGKVEQFSKEEIFERDGWTCHICKNGIDRNVDFRHPLSPTLDHLIPISLSGSHTKLNVKTAHRRCNSRRRNNKPAQLVLV